MDDRSGRCREKEKSVPPRLLPCSSLCLRADKSRACSSSRAALWSARACRRRHPVLLLTGLTDEARLRAFSLCLRRTLVDEMGDEGSESSERRGSDVNAWGVHWRREMTMKRWPCVCVGERKGANKHEHTHEYSVRVKGKTRKEKLISKAHRKWEKAFRPCLLQRVKLIASGKFSSAKKKSIKKESKIKISERA